MVAHTLRCDTLTKVSAKDKDKTLHAARGEQKKAPKIGGQSAYGPFEQVICAKSYSPDFCCQAQ